MSDTTTKTVLIDVQLKAEQLTKELPALAEQIRLLTDAQAKYRKEGLQGTTVFQRNAQDLRELSAQYRDANKYIDNVAKARNSENNSIQQNRALLSLLTNDYVKLGQQQGKTSTQTLALGKTINDLTDRLKNQEKQIGQTYRNVGNYAQSIVSAIPGMSKYSTLITNATKAFNFMGSASKSAAGGVAEVSEGAGAAEVGVGGISGAMMGMVAAAVAVVAIIGVVISWFGKLTPNAEALKRNIAGLGSAYNAFMSDLGKGVGFGELFDDMAKAYKQAKELTGAMQDLARESQIVAVANANADATIADLQLKMRNRRNTPAQEKAYFDQIQQVSNDSYKQRKDVADKEYDLAVKAATIGRKFTDDELRQLHEKGIAYAAYLDKIKGLNNKEGAGTDLANIAKAQEDQAAATRYQETIQDRAQNRLDANQMKAEQAAQKDLDTQNQIKQKIAEINSQRIASITHMLEFEQESFGKEISSTDEHYRQLIFKQQKYIEEAKKIQASKKSSAKTKALAGEQISAAEAGIAQLQKERFSESEKLLIDHNRQMIEIVAKGALDLRNIQIANIENDQKRELAGIDNQFEEKLLTYKKQNDNYQENIRKLKTEISNKAKEPKSEIQQNELQALQTALNAQNALLGQNTDIVIADEKAKQKAIDATNKKYLDQSNSIRDQSAILDAGKKKGITGGKDNPFNSDLKNAQQQQLLDQYNAEVTQKGLTEEAKALIEKQYLLKSKELNEQNAKSKQAVEIQGAQIVANAAFSIIQNANKSAAQATQVQLSKSKETELANTSLTSAQKLAVNNKYRILEGQAKVKEFRADQKLSFAKASIAGAEAIIKAVPNPVLVALAAAITAAELAVIVTQQPPAYAKGGVHTRSFASDGKGSVLPGYSRKDNVNAQLRSGEAVIVSEAVRNPYARSILSGINQAFGGRSFGEVNPGNGYAIGGIVSDGNNSNRYYAQPQQGTENLANSIAFSLINNFPPVITQVRDINTQQGILNKTVDRVNI